MTFIVPDTQQGLKNVGHPAGLLMVKMVKMAKEKPMFPVLLDSVCT